MGQYYTFPYSPMGVQVLWTFFVLRGEPVIHFVNNCSNSFFEAPLPHRYFFENDFYQVVFRQGFLPRIRDYIVSHTGAVSYEQKIAQWKAVNGIQ